MNIQTEFRNLMKPILFDGILIHHRRNLQVRILNLIAFHLEKTMTTLNSVDEEIIFSFKTTPSSNVNDSHCRKSFGFTDFS